MYLRLKCPQDSQILPHIFEHVHFSCFFFSDIILIEKTSNKLNMVNKCCVVNCRSNYAGEENTTVFSFPKDEDLKKKVDKVCK